MSSMNIRNQLDAVVSEKIEKKLTYLKPKIHSIISTQLRNRPELIQHMQNEQLRKKLTVKILEGLKSHVPNNKSASDSEREFIKWLTSQQNWKYIPRIYSGEFSYQVLGNIPELFHPYIATKYSNNFYSQTGLMMLKSTIRKLYWHQELIETNDGLNELIWASYDDNFSFDQPISDIILIAHGLQGWRSSDLIHKLCKEALKRGYQPMIVCKMGHGTVPLKRPILRIPGDGFEHRLILEYLREKFTLLNKKHKITALNGKILNIFGIGISAGAADLISVMTNHPDDPIFSGCVCISPPFKSLREVSDQLNSIMNKKMTNMLKKIILKNEHVFENLNLDNVKKSQNLLELSEHAYKPLYGHNVDLGSYTMINNLNKINCFLMVIVSDDDQVTPIDYSTLLHAIENKYISVINTKIGGHCGFYRGFLRQSNFAVDVSMKYIENVKIIS